MEEINCTCIKCQHTGQLIEFVTDKRMKLGVQNICRKCKGIQKRKYWAENKSVLNQKQKLYAQTQQAKKVKSEWAKNNKIKFTCDKCQKEFEIRMDTYKRKKSNICRVCNG